MHYMSANLVLPLSITKPPSSTIGTAYLCTCCPCFTNRKGRNTQFTSDLHCHLTFPKLSTWDGRFNLKPRRYSCEDMTTGLIGIFGINPRHNRCSIHLKYQALTRWQSWVESQRQMPSSDLALKQRINLDFFHGIFDHYFFYDVLSEWTRIKWFDYDQNMSRSLGNQMDDPEKPHPYGLVKIVDWGSVKPGGPSAIMQTLNTLLHEMVHSMLNTYTCRCRCASATSEVRGHGPLWKKLARALSLESA